MTNKEYQIDAKIISYPGIKTHNKRFCQIEVMQKEFNSQRTISDVNKVVVSK